MRVTRSLLKGLHLRPDRRDDRGPCPPLIRRDPDVSQETWRINYGDVVVGTISQCVGNPGAAPRWQLRCGFYPGSRPGRVHRRDDGDVRQGARGLRARMSRVPIEAYRS
jgi:hypothetical protein